MSYEWDTNAECPDYFGKIIEQKIILATAKHLSRFHIPAIADFYFFLTMGYLMKICEITKSV
jgi:hypothetical protein